MTYTKEQIAAHIDHRANCIGEDSKDVRILRQLVSQILVDWKVSTATPSQGADAIIDAMPSMVQSLVWGVDLRGRSISGEYTIWQFQTGFFVEHGQDGETITNPLKTLEAAKAAAQAHHVATILSAFGVQGGET